MQIPVILFLIFCIRDSSKKWQEKADLLSQLETQVKRMKENFDAKEQLLLEERQKATEAHKYADEHGMNSRQKKILEVKIQTQRSHQNRMIIMIIILHIKYLDQYLCLGCGVCSNFLEESLNEMLIFIFRFSCRAAVEKLHSVDNAFRHQLESVQAAHLADLLQLENQKQAQIDQANSKVNLSTFYILGHFKSS